VGGRFHQGLSRYSWWPQLPEGDTGAFASSEAHTGGGVSLENVADFIKAGAVAVAVGGNLVKKRAIAEGNFAELTETARQFVAAIRGARGG